MIFHSKHKIEVIDSQHFFYKPYTLQYLFTRRKNKRLLDIIKWCLFGVILFIITLMLFISSVNQADAATICKEQCKFNRELKRICPRSVVMSIRKCRKWLMVAQCESGSSSDKNITLKSVKSIQWKYNGRSGFDGGLQFSQRTWNGNIGRIKTNLLTKQEQNKRIQGSYKTAWKSPSHIQILTAEVLRTRRDSNGLNNWPKCGNRFFLNI